MIKVYILERDGENLAKSLRTRTGGRGVSITPVENSACDILVISPGAADMAPPHTVTCGLLLVPEPARAEFAEAGCIITYGMSGRSTLTISSIGGGEDMIAVQREIPTVTGHIIERQEISASGGGGPERLLAIEGTMLLLGAYK